MTAVPDLPKAEFMRRDLFPAVVRGEAIDGGAIDNVRAVITDAHVHVIRLSPTGDLELAYSFVLDSVSYVDGRRERGMNVKTADAGDLFVGRSGGCGCGMTRLKATRLYSYPVPLTAIT